MWVPRNRSSMPAEKKKWSIPTNSHASRVASILWAISIWYSIFSESSFSLSHACWTTVSTLNISCTCSSTIAYTHKLCTKPTWTCSAGVAIDHDQGEVWNQNPTWNPRVKSFLPLDTCTYRRTLEGRWPWGWYVGWAWGMCWSIVISFSP